MHVTRLSAHHVHVRSGTARPHAITGAVLQVFRKGPQIPTITMLSLLALLSPALAIPFPFNLPAWNTQTPFLPSNFKVDTPKVEIGWADPRILGGQFIDVNFLSFAPTSP